MNFRVLVLMLLCGCSQAATYYVSPSGNNANSGSSLAPWLTIGKATSTAVAGDTVVIRAGTYNEFVDNSTSGTSGNPITFVGERDGSGNWLTIIDPSTAVTSGWVAATEFGGGCYKHTGLAFTTQELTVDNKRVAFVYALTNISSSVDQAYISSGISNGYQFLSLPSAKVLYNSMSGASNVWWDSVGALWCATGSVTYLRFRDGSSPNGRNITICQNAVASQTDVANPAINLAANYVTWSNVLVQGSACQIYVTGHDNAIQSNYLQNGFVRVKVSTANSYHNRIANNSMTANYYGFSDPGAWQTGAPNPAYNFVERENLYLVAKFLMGVDTSFDYGLYLLDAGSSNIITGNNIFKGIGVGIDLFTVVASYPPTTNTLITANTFANAPSGGILLSEGELLTQCYSNMVSDCNINVRLNHVDASTDTNRSGYIYRNTFWLPNGAGQHFYVHLSSPSGQFRFPDYWVYHNSFSGGQVGLSISSYVDANGGLTNTHFLNNLISSTEYIDGGNSDIQFWTNASMIKTYDYNLVTPPYPTFPASTNPAWFASHNIKSTTNQWVNTLGMSFAIPSGSQAINAAIDVTVPFSVEGVSYPALPVTPIAKTGTDWDIGAYESSSGVGRIMRVTNLHINSAHVP